MTRYLLLVLAILPLAVAAASAEIIDHSSIAGVASLPQSTMDAIGQQKWMFTHASVGANMVEGMNGLHSANPTRYQLEVATGYATAPPPDPTKPGTVYQIDRGNPGWSLKFSTFQSLVTNYWHSPTVNFVMDKLCYIDQGASSTTYLSMMASLEAAYPNTTFVYTTMPLMTTEDGDNILRNNYNYDVRKACAAYGGLLFDIADIESHDLNGNACTFVSGDKTYQKLYTGYCSDYLQGGAHLNSTGSQQVALGWYATAATAVPEPSVLILLAIGGVLFIGRRLTRR
jgi:hypothetical protein